MSEANLRRKLREVVAAWRAMANYRAAEIPRMMALEECAADIEELLDETDEPTESTRCDDDAKPREASD